MTQWPLAKYLLTPVI